MGTPIHLNTKKSGMVIIFSLCVKTTENKILQPVQAHSRNLNEGLPVSAQV